VNPRNHITAKNVTASRIAGRDVFESSKIKKPEDGGTVIQYPLEWMKPMKSGGGITFGEGIGYATGLTPSNAGAVFPSGKRICLVETITPIVETNVFTVESFSGPVSVTGITVASVEKSCIIQAIPSPYVSQGGRIKYPDPCDPEISIVVLGYRSPDGRMAIAEKLRNDEYDSYLLRLYPHYLEPGNYFLTPSPTEAAAKYYYSRKEIEEDPDIYT
jgi:hypothetical protein